MTPDGIDFSFFTTAAACDSGQLLCSGACTGQVFVFLLRLQLVEHIYLGSHLQTACTQE